MPSVAPPDVPFGVYVHVPFCAVRCGYCDFNTYTATELGGGGSQAAYAGHAVAEVEYAGRSLGADRPQVETVFFGGGTPTLLPADDLMRVLGPFGTTFGLAPDAEVTTEANPDSVTPDGLAALREGGFNRVSFGMQSAVPHVLRVLERTHDPANVARAVGLGTGGRVRAGQPGPDLRDAGGVAGRLAASVESALACEPDHVSAYSLIVEDGTRLARQVRTGVIPAPDDDDLAEKYVLADDAFAAAGLGWYEVSNWARDEAARCRHNELYWTSASWWGDRPGRALARGGGALVERQAPQRVRRPDPGRRVAGAGRRGPRRRHPAPRAGAAGGPPARRPPARPGGPRPRRRRRRPRPRGARTATASCSPAGAACSLTPWCASWSGRGCRFPRLTGDPCRFGALQQPNKASDRPSITSTDVDTRHIVNLH